MGTKIKRENIMKPEEIKAVREKLNLTQEQFAAKIGATVTSVNRWENGKAEPSPLAIKAIKEL